MEKIESIAGVFGILGLIGVIISIVLMACDKTQLPDNSWFAVSWHIYYMFLLSSLILFTSIAASKENRKVDALVSNNN